MKIEYIKIISVNKNFRTYIIINFEDLQNNTKTLRNIINKKKT